MPNSHRSPDATRQSCEVSNCCQRVQTSNFLSATVLSCRESNSHRRSGRGTDKTVLSCLAFRCGLALNEEKCEHITGHRQAEQSRGVCEVIEVSSTERNCCEAGVLPATVVSARRSTPSSPYCARLSTSSPCSGLESSSRRSHTCS